MNKPMFVHANDVQHQELTSRHVAMFYADDVRHEIGEWLNQLKGVLGTEHSDNPATGDSEDECPVCVTLREMRLAAGKSAESAK